MVMVRFKKMTFAELPKNYRDAIQSWDEKDGILIDTSVLTPEERDKGLEWLTSNGYKQV